MPEFCTAEPSSAAAGVPRAVHRRLRLALAGWRCAAGIWSWYGLWPISEEQVDALDDAAFEGFVTTSSAVSAVSAHEAAWRGR